jgi:vacuolar-type H+-ATPase subunit F/Vma7
MDEELEQKQIKNIRNKVRDIINKADPKIIVQIGMMLGVNVPVELQNKYYKTIE